MAELSGFPTAEVTFDRAGKATGGVGGVRQLARDPALTDLLVLSHGWNNTAAQARGLYRGLAASLRAVLGTGLVPGMAGRRIGLCCVIWPSKQFAESDLVPRNAASASSALDADAIDKQLKALRKVFPAARARQTLDTMRELVPTLPDRKTARAKFADLARSLLDPDASDLEDGSVDLFEVSAADLIERLALPVSLAPPEDNDGDGGAAGLPTLLGGVFGAARNLLNFTTYYEMKARAGVVGERGLAPIVDGIHDERPDLRIHLAGHSFGGRLVAAAARAMAPSAPGPVATLTMLQAAFSHFGFAKEWEPRRPGFFRPVLDRKTISGPTLITHTGNDKAVGIAYAIASRIAGQAGARVGAADDTFGGIGRNGAQRTSETVTARLLDVGKSYTWRAGKLHNLNADEFISDHSDVTGREVAYALLSAMATT